MEKGVSDVYNIFLVVMFETAEITGVKQDKDNHNLCITHTVGFVTMPGFLILNHIFFSAVMQIPCKNHRPYNKSL
jgi:hypothetical protein